MKRIFYRIDFVCIIFMFSIQLIQAQWVQTNGPTGGHIYTVAISDSIFETSIPARVGTPDANSLHTTILSCCLFATRSFFSATL